MSDLNINWREDNGVFLPMINDTGRNVFYKSLIQNNVRDKVVVDIGAGTGFLSVLAHKAGAKKVYAVEGDLDRYRFLKYDVIEKMGLQKEVIAVHSNFLNFNIPGDVYITETFGWNIFNENIIEIARHAKNLGGTFLPGSVKVWVEVYNNHPIFPMMQKYSDAYDFCPDISIDPVYENLISQEVYSDDVKFKANCLPNFFNFYKNDDTLSKQIKLDTVYKSDYLDVDFNSPIDINDLEITIPLDKLSQTENLAVALFWKAEYGNDSMDVRDTWWSTPTKVIPTINRDLVIKYIPSKAVQAEDILRSAYGSWYFYY